MPEAREPEQPDLEEVAARCLERMHEEGEAALDDTCRQYPEHADVLRELVRQLASVGILQGPGQVLPDRIGDYAILDRLGSGGMGDVYLAEHQGRRVALKVMRPGYHADPKGRERFRREVDALSRLDHPGICAVLGSGEVDGRPYLAMQLIEGETLAASLDRRRRAQPAAGSTPAAEEIDRDLQLVEKLARAVHAAHEAGFVHRDLKPANVVIDRAGEPVVLDFGLVHEDGGAADTLTRTGDVLGTPAYMAPEQVRGDSSAVDRRADVYALGAILYECLTHRPPFEARSRDALYQQILNESVPDPSRYNRRVGAALRTVLLAALEKSPDRRLPTASRLAGELARIRSGQPIATRGPGVPARAVRWARRNRTASAVLLTALAGLVVALGLLYLVDHERRRLRALLWTAVARELQGLDDTLAFKFAREAMELDPVGYPRTMAGVQEAMFRLTPVVPLCEDPCLQAIWAPDGSHLALHVGAGRESRLFSGAGKLVCMLPKATAVAFSRDSRRLAVAGSDGAVRIATIGAGPPSWAEFPAPQGAPARAVVGLSYSPAQDRRLLVSYLGKRAVLLDEDGYGPVFGDDGSQRPWAAAFLPDGRVIAGGALWDGAGPPKRVLSEALEADGDYIEHIAVAQDRFVTVSFRGRLRIWDRSGRPQGSHRDYPRDKACVTSVTLSPGGEHVLVTMLYKRVELLDQDGGVLWSEATSTPAMSGQFSKDGGHVLIGEWDAPVSRLSRGDWAPAPGWRVGRFGSVRSVAESPVSGLVVTAGDAGARLWDPTRSLAGTLHPSGGWACLAVSPRAPGRIVVASKSGRGRLLDGDGAVLRETSLPPATVQFPRVSADGRFAIIAGEDGNILRWDLVSGGETRLEFGAPIAKEAAIVTDGRLAILTGEQRCVLWDPSAPDRRVTLPGRHTSVASSADGTVLVTGDVGGVLRVWNPAGTLARPLAVKLGPVRTVALDRSARRVLVSSTDKKAYLVDRISGEVLQTFTGHQGTVIHSAFSPDERRIATASGDRTVRVWDVATGDPLLILTGHTSSALRVEFLGDHRLVSSSDDGTVRFWYLDRQELGAVVSSLPVPPLTDDERRQFEPMFRGKPR